MNFEVGDRITLLYDDLSEYKESFREGEVFSYSADTIPEIALLPVGYYQYTANFYDVYDNVYHAGTAVTYFDGKTMKIITITQDYINTE